MKHKLHKLMAMFIASIFAVSAWAQQDMTSKIVNAELSDNAEGWNIANGKHEGGLMKYGSGKNLDFNQTITLPAGQYKMTAKAAYRYGGGDNPEQVEYDAIQSGVDTHLAKFYAETATYKYETNVMNRWEGASDTDYAAGSGSVTVNGKFVPNSSSAVLAWFKAGQYVNELVFNVQEEGEVKIGILKTVNPEGIGGDYANISSWTLTRLGDAEADPNDYTSKVGTSKEAWHTGGGPVNIEGVSMPEHYLGNTTTLGVLMWQDVTGLANGTYTVELWANARYTPGRGFETKAEDGALNFTYLSANNVEISIPVVYNGDANNNTSHVLENVYVTDGTLRIAMSKKAEGSNWHTIQIKSLIYHGLDEAALFAYAKENLKAALDEANAVEPKKDDFVAAIAAAQSVYDGSESTDEVNATIATLKEATKLAILGNASEENPVVTDFVVNGTFDKGTAPWKTTTGAQNQGTATNQAGAFTGNFFENWNPSPVAGKIYQVIENVPNGVYELSICAFVSVFDASAQFVYANGDKEALTAGAPTAYTVRTVVVNGTIEVGFEQTTAVAEWMGIDNVSLTYYGPASNSEALEAAKVAFLAKYANFEALSETLDYSWNYINNENYFPVQEEAFAIKEAVDEVTDASVLETLMAKMAEAEALLAEVKAAAADYNYFKGLLENAADFSTLVNEEECQAACSVLENYGMMFQYNAASVKDIEDATAAIKAAYIKFVANAAPAEGTMFDMTFAIQNPNFDKNVEGWTCVKARHNGGEGYDGVGGIAEIGEWGATSWDASMSQTLTELPNGKYVVKASWMSANGIQMTFAANEGTTTVTGIGDQGGNIAKDGSVVEMGQGHRGWQYVEVECVVVDGTLAIVVSSSSSAQYQWSNADAFELYYAGKDGDVDTGISAPAMQNVETIIYDLQGRRVQKMEKGLYIVNGVKRVVK